MSVLSGPEIENIVNRTRGWVAARRPAVLPAIDVEPFVPGNVGPNSYDLTLAPDLLVYATGEVVPLFLGSSQADRGTGLHVFAGQHPDLFRDTVRPLDARADNPTFRLTIPDGGLVLVPGVLYLGSTVERTATAGCVPCIETRSSVARLGISTHLSAGFGDDGFGCGPDGEVDATRFGATWTLEITVAHPVRVYAGMRIAQIAYTTLTGDRRPYRGRYGAQVGPVASRLWADAPTPRKED